MDMNLKRGANLLQQCLREMDATLDDEFARKGHYTYNRAAEILEEYLVDLGERDRQGFCTALTEWLCSNLCGGALELADWVPLREFKKLENDSRGPRLKIVGHE